MLQVLAGICSIVSLVCWVLTLIKMFQNMSPIHGILGILTCGLYALVMGFVKMKEWNNAPVMFTWLGATVLGMILNVAAGAAAAGG